MLTRQAENKAKQSNKSGLDRHTDTLALTG